MEFIEMRDRLIEHFNEMVKDVDHLFIVNIDKDLMWETYLTSYPAGTNPTFRKRSEHDCSCCRGFIKNIGNVVSIKNGKITTIWDFECHDATYDPVIKAMRDLIKGQKVTDVFLSTEKKIGCHHNFEMMEAIGAHRWDHFYLELPRSVIHIYKKHVIQKQILEKIVLIEFLFIGYYQVLKLADPDLSHHIGMLRIALCKKDIGRV